MSVGPLTSAIDALVALDDERSRPRSWWSRWRGCGRGVEHVEVLSRARDRNRSTAHVYVRDEAMLVDWATTEELEDFRVMVDAWVIAVDTHDAERRAARQHERRGLWMTQETRAAVVPAR